MRSNVTLRRGGGLYPASEEQRDAAAFAEYCSSPRRVAEAFALAGPATALLVGSLTPDALQTELEDALLVLAETRGTLALAQHINANVNMVNMVKPARTYPARALVWLLVRIAHENNATLFPPYLDAKHKDVLSHVYARIRAVVSPAPITSSDSLRGEAVRAEAVRVEALRAALFPVWRDATVSQGRRRLDALKKLVGEKLIKGFTRDELVAHLTWFLRHAVDENELVFAVERGVQEPALGADLIEKKLVERAERAARFVVPYHTINGIIPGSWSRAPDQAGGYSIRQKNIKAVRFPAGTDREDTTVEVVAITGSTFAGTTLAALDIGASVISTSFNKFVARSLTVNDFGLIAGTGPDTDAALQGVQECNFTNMRLGSCGITTTTLRACKFDDTVVAGMLGISANDVRGVSFRRVRAAHVSLAVGQAYDLSLSGLETKRLDLRGAFFGLLALDNVRVTEGRFDCVLDRNCKVSLANAVLTGVDFGGVTLYANNTLFKGASFRDAVFGGAKIVGKLEHADFRGADVWSLDLSAATIDSTCKFDATG